MKVTSSIAEKCADQEFFTDVFTVFLVSCKSTVLRWPGHLSLIENLQASRKVQIKYQVLRSMFPKWERKGIMGFLHHYNRYDYMQVSFRTELNDTDVIIQSIVSSMEERFAVMLGVPIPTQAERIIEGKRLDMIGFHERAKRAGKLPSSQKAAKQKKASKLANPQILPSILLRSLDNYTINAVADASASRHQIISHEASGTGGRAGVGGIREQAEELNSPATVAESKILTKLAKLELMILNQVPSQAKPDIEREISIPPPLSKTDEGGFGESVQGFFSALVPPLSPVRGR